MEGDLFCNVKKCRKRISSGLAWATSCSHVFCYEDGQNILASSKVCPACSSSLKGKFDIIRIDTNPDEAYRSMVLLGQRPDVVLDISNRAISAWLYQSQQEYMYKQYLLNKAEEKYANLKRYCDQFTSSMQLENKALKEQLASAGSEIALIKKLNEELTEKLRDKTRQYQKLQVIYNRSRRTSLQPNREERFSAGGDGDKAGRSEAFLSAFDAPVGASTHPSRSCSPQDAMFRQSHSTPNPFEMRVSQPPSPFANIANRAPAPSSGSSFRRFFN